MAKYDLIALNNDGRTVIVDWKTGAKIPRPAALRQKIKKGEMSFAQVMAQSADPIVARMKVSTLLESLPGFGKAKAAKIMTELQISESRRVQGLGARQREALMERLG